MQVGGAIGQYGNCFPLAHGITGVERMSHTIQSTTQLVQHFPRKPPNMDIFTILLCRFFPMVKLQ